MKKVLLGLSFLVTIVSFSFAQQVTAVEEGINWLTWEEAMEASKKEPKKIFIDVYTDWCGWCKRMDATTFVDTDVVEYMNENYYAVKMDAESRKDLEYKGKTYSFDRARGRRGIHTLAYKLLNGRAAYPSVVYLDEVQGSLKVSPGYKTPELMLNELKDINGVKK